MPSVRAWILIGVTVRAAMLALSLPVELQSDESQYAVLGLGWERLGFLSDSQRFLWPPAYPYIHKLGFSLFGENGILAVRVFQVICSAATGWGVAALTGRLVSREAAPWATGLWALHLPLAGYCVLGWPESLFLAALLPALVFLHDAERQQRPSKLVLAGLLIGTSALFKELGLALAILLLLRSAVAALRTGRSNPGASTLTLSLAIALPLLPWTIRNLTHHQSLIPSGSTLGENAFHGLNARDTNFDLLPALRASGLDPRPDTSGPEWLQPDPDTAWERPHGESLTERQSHKLKSGLGWVSSNPSAFLRSRLSKYAQTLSPLSFPVRHLALQKFGGVLGSGAPGRGLLILGTLQSGLLLLFGAAAIARSAPRNSLYLITLACFLAQPLLVGMSRLRVPLLPLLMIALAAWLTEKRSERSPLAPLGAAALVMVLWGMNMDSIRWLLDYAWGALA